ncbi:MAG: 50S ribosome-binding GTPase [Phycisphaerales bacterium]|nr:50S ribosome-binding GTPase [Phycisphaerales bacterium]
MKTVVVRLTGSGVGAIAGVLVAGVRAMEVAGKVTGGKAVGLRVNGAVHTAIVNAAGEVVDDAMAVRVGEEHFELHTHGGTAVVAAVIRAVEEAGAQQVSLEKANRLGLLGRGIAGEVMMAMPLTRTITAVRLIASQAEEGLTRWAREWRAWAEGKAAGELWRLHAAAQWLLERSRSLFFLLEPPRVAIVGPPNAGKSTLANALLGRQVAITSAIAGTTRDWVDAMATFVAGNIQVAVTLIDTAGVRETSDVLELESISRTHQQAYGADVIVLLMDGSRPQEGGAQDRAMLERYRGGVVAMNKCDLEGGGETFAENMESGIRVSAKTGAGLDELMRAVLVELDLAEVRADEPFAFSKRQRDVLVALSLAEDTPEALSLLEALVIG